MSDDEIAMFLGGMSVIGFIAFFILKSYFKRKRAHSHSE